MKRLTKWLLFLVLAVVLIACICYIMDAGKSQGAKSASDQLSATDSLVKMPPSEGSRHCLSVRQMLYIASLVKVEGGKVCGLKDERAINRLMSGMGYRKERYDFLDQDGAVTAYAYDCELDETGSMVRARSRYANRVLVACGYQPESSILVALVVADRTTYDELRMQIYAQNYYKGEDEAFHKEGSRFCIFPSELMDGNGFELDVRRE